MGSWWGWQGGLTSLRMIAMHAWRTWWHWEAREVMMSGKGSMLRWVGSKPVLGRKGQQCAVIWASSNQHRPWFVCECH